MEEPEALPSDINMEERKKMVERQLKEILLNKEKYKSIGEAKREQRKHNKDYLRTKRQRKLAEASRARNRGR